MRGPRYGLWSLRPLCLSFTAATNVDGGAVELSWKLRPASSSFADKFVECDSGPLADTPGDRRSGSTGK